MKKNDGAAIRRLGTRAAVLLILVSASSCIRLGDGTNRNLTTEQIIAALRARGIEVVGGERAMNSSLSVPGHSFSIEGGGELQIYEYQSETSAVLDASRFERGSMTVTGPPHFYHRENIIALYSGRDPVVESALTDILGGQRG